MKRMILILSLLMLPACNYLAYTNIKLEPAETPPTASKASFTLAQDRGQWADKSGGKTLFVLALSGGGSRAAYWSAAAMLRLKTLFADQGVDLLAEVDAISSISGGSMAAAYYSVSADNEDDASYKTARGKRPLWQDQPVKQALTKNFTLRWFGNWFWPHNVARYWFTAYDRTDIMAETLADNLFETSRGHDFTLGEINPTRPNLILNATISSGEGFSKGFALIGHEFREKLYSDVNEYELARAVMASASFPAAFNSMTLKNYGYAKNTLPMNNGAEKPEAFLHVIDGGSHDNLGLRSAVRFIRQNHHDYDRVAVILIDAYTPPAGVSSEQANPRGLFDYIIDTNFMDSVNALMDRNRSDVLKEMWDYALEVDSEGVNKRKHVEFYHATFQSIDQAVMRQRSPEHSLRKDVNHIKTSLMISQDGQRAIDEAVDYLFNKDNICLQKIAQLISGKPMPDTGLIQHGATCLWPLKVREDA